MTFVDRESSYRVQITKRTTPKLLNTGVWDLVSRGLEPNIHILTTLVFLVEFATIRSNNTFMFTSI